MKSILILFFLSINFFGFSQTFLPNMERFSSKKLDYLVLKSGETIEFYLDDLDRKKGLINKIEGKTVDGEKIVFKAEDVKEVFLVPSDFAKLNAAGRATRSVLKVTRTNMKELSREHVQFQTEFLDDKKMTVLLQKINPDFDSYVEVFADPWAMETMGLGIGGVQLTGGIAKSYYIKYNGAVFKTHKRHYEDLFATLYAKCPAVLEKYKSPAWRDFPLHLDTYETSCIEQK